MNANETTALPARTTGKAMTEDATRTQAIGSEAVWRELEKAAFAVLGHVTAAGEPRSSGVVYTVVDRRLYVAVAPDGWKARQIETGQEVAVTVPVRRGGILALLVPIPPATITFRARAIVHEAGSLDAESVAPKLARMIPEARRASACILELLPEGRFLTYGVGVSLRAMCDPVLARASVPVA